MKIHIWYILVILNGLFNIQPLLSTNRDVERTTKFIRLIENNLPYDEDITTDSIITWEKDLEVRLESEQKLELLFLLKRLVSSAYARQGDITIAVNKAQTMYEKAKNMGYNLGMAYSLQAIGDAYLNANLKNQAINFYKDALSLLDSSKEFSNKQKVQIYSNLIQALLHANKPEESLVYLKLLGDCFDQDPTSINHFLISACNAFYFITTGEMEKAKFYLQEAEKVYNQLKYPYCKYVLLNLHASFYKHNKEYELALKQYDQLYQSQLPASTLSQNIQLSLRQGELLSNLGKTDEACRVFQKTIAMQDSLDNLSYIRQINELRTIYQIDQIEVRNQAIRNKIITWSVVIVLVILTVIIILAILIRKDNKRLLRSKTELEKAQKYAQKSILTKSILLSNMSHEIRTPLNALSGFSAILTEDSIDNETRRQCNEIIQQNSDLLLNLINDVIDLSNFEVGKLTFNFKANDAVSICRNVIDTVEKVKQTQARVRFVTGLDSLSLITDDSRLQQVLINLLINATKFTPEGMITLELQKQTEEIARFSVTDTGCGIPREKQGQIFNRFEKLNENAQGTGLGLSICQLIIEQIGGEIWIDPDYTEGSRFIFTHPLNPVPPKDEIK